MINVLSKFSTCVERASIDEAYIDLTEEVKRRIDSRPKQEQLQNTFIVGYDKDGITSIFLVNATSFFGGKIILL